MTSEPENVLDLGGINIYLTGLVEESMVATASSALSSAAPHHHRAASRTPGQHSRGRDGRRSPVPPSTTTGTLRAEGRGECPAAFSGGTKTTALAAILANERGTTEPAEGLKIPGDLPVS